ncbi:hypothetical protein [Trinickia diaoshuihuensis]|uniref:hypothetical protein n=1 Tax=Trinickia diaoshuihuensis TaxID=2292265 RepID=UPI000E25DFDD|nr:hypothetical protein [Trinickia diaoshuihuensis]
MKIPVVYGAVVLAVSTPALAQRPAVYPLRSQTAATQSLDNAYCYGEARRQTGVDMARQSQRPMRTKPLQFAADGGRGASEPPLPATRAASGSAAHGAKPGAQTSEVHAAASAGPSASSPAVDAPARPGTASGSAGADSAASTANLPPLPPPQSPMETYWQAYGDCMQSRGYGVQ